MSIKIGTGSAAVDLSSLRASGIAVNRVMVGTGSAAVAAWVNTIYPLFGSWGSLTFSGTRRVQFTHVIAETGTYSFSHMVSRTGGAGSIRAHITGPWGTTSGSSSTSTSSASTTGRALTAGQTIYMESDGLNNTSSGTWTIAKTA